ncbi:hypothetical protein LNV09_14455 [Paucibacter sp. B2R-40]|uniref:hypothetical protein n=1 Tax=Paucibacter sp. B2R-40 TaxID=2893554 RepID=UPI0021E4C42A|nr:hypothetical protein [Paucibacter sp. B2R-40]MCV2355352.1 hypothetical protein [Paucibacter sp. B2R-40]
MRTEFFAGYEFNRKDPVGYFHEEHGGYDEAKKKFKPLKCADTEVDVCDILNAITAAVEAGIVKEYEWPKQLFASKSGLAWFLEQLSTYDDCFRIPDRWWQALAHLGDSTNCEESFSRCDDIANTLERRIEELPEEFRVHKAEIKYFKANPLPPHIHLTAKQTDAFYAHRRAVQDIQRADRSIKDDDTCRFSFTQPFYEIRDGVMYCRQATAADIASLVPAKKPKAVAKKPAATKKPATKKAKA